MAGTQALSLVSALLFFVGLAPAAWLIQIWRRPDQLAFHGLSGLDPAELADIAEAEGVLGYRHRFE